MPMHQYACPKCGVALRSAQDVSGRKVRCLDCQTIFVAKRPSTSEPPQVKVPPPPQKRERTPSPEPPRPSLPPIPTNRKAPMAIFVVGGALLLAIGLTIVVIREYKDTKVDDNKALVEKKDKAKSQTTVTKAPTTDSMPPTPVETTITRREEEEEAPVVPASNPSVNVPAKSGEPKIPDIGSILPKLPGPDVPVVKKSDSGTKPPETKPPEGKSDPSDPPLRGDGQIPPALLAKLKAATVFIKVHAGAWEATGSGFLLRVDSDTALIVTNEHVAVPPAKAGVARRAELEVVFHSSRKNEFVRKAELIAADEDHDLAVLRITGVRGAADFPSPLNTTEKLALSETMPVYVIGFPFGEMLSTTRGNPAVTIGKGTISSLREDEAGDPAFIQIDGDVNPGNSGGPVVDSRGRLVGVTVAKLKGTNIGMAIPKVELTRMLVGRVGNLEFRINRVIRDTIEMDVRGSLIDPLDRVKSSSLRVVRADDLKSKPAVGADGKWSALDGSEKRELKISGRGVSGRVDLPLRARDRGQIEIFFQPACVDHDGKTHFFAPVTQTLKITEGGPGPFGPMVPGMPPGPGGALPAIPPGIPMPMIPPGGTTVPGRGPIAPPTPPRRPN